MKRKQIKTLLLFLLYPIVAGLVTFFFGLNSVWSIVFFILIPSIHLSLLIPRKINKALVFASVISLPSIVVFDSWGHLAGQWFIPTIFPFRIFNLAPLESLIWAFGLVYFIVMFYEYFLDSDKDARLWHKRMRYITFFFLSVLVLFPIILHLSPSTLQIPFYYFWSGLILFLIPVIIELVRKPHLIIKFALVGLYFFVLILIYEIVALNLDWWIFNEPTMYLGWLSIFGVGLPIEEFIYFLVLTTLAVLAFYEFFDDDEK